MQCILLPLSSQYGNIYILCWKQTLPYKVFSCSSAVVGMYLEPSATLKQRRNLNTFAGVYVKFGFEYFSGCEE